MSLVKEFKEFALKGNVVDLAVAVIIGGAFGRVISSVVADILLPPIGLFLGGVNFNELKYILKEEIPAQLDAAGAVIVEMVPAVSINYGSFIQVVIDFAIMAFAIFMIIRGINKAKKKEEEAPAAPPAPTEDQKLLTEIRDLLKK